MRGVVDGQPIVRDAEPIDRIAGDRAATAWRQSARRHQATWRAAHGWPPGTQSKGKGRGESADRFPR